MAIEEKCEYKENGRNSHAHDEETPFTRQSDENTRDNEELDRKIRFCTKLNTDKVYREKYLTSIALLWSFVILGWVAGQVGPSFLDLKIITNITLDKASVYLTSHSVGYLLGSFIVGFLYDKVQFDKKLLIVFVLLGYSIILAVLPWSGFYEVMIVTHIIKGLFGGGLDTSGNAHLVNLWGSDGRSFMQALHFAFAFGGILSPYAIAPFLAPEGNKLDTAVSSIPYPSSVDLNQNGSIHGDSGYKVSQSSGIQSEMLVSTISVTTDIPTQIESQIYIAYSITGALSITGAIPFIILFIRYNNSKRKTERVENRQQNSTYLSLAMKILILMNLTCLLGFYVSVEEGFNAFLATFCVKYLNWGKYEGSIVTSLFWGTFALGRFLGIFVIRYVRPARMIFGLLLLLLLTFIGFFFSAYLKYHNGIWISTAFAGIAMSVIFPSVFTWTEEEILPVTGRVASLFMISASAGAMISPIILGMLMDQFSPMWFTYILLGFIVLTFILFISALCLSCKIRLPKHTFRDVEIEIRSEIQDDLDQQSVICESEIGEIGSLKS